MQKEIALEVRVHMALCWLKLCSKRSRAVTRFPLMVMLTLTEDGEGQAPC